MAIHDDAGVVGWLRAHLRPLRVRLTLSFALVVALVLAGTGVLVYAQFARNLDSRTDGELAERQSVIVGLASAGRPASEVLALSGEPIAQIFGADTRVAATTRALGSRPVLSASQVARARTTPLAVTAPVVASTDDGARLRAFSIANGGVAVIGESRDDRELELNHLALLLALTLPGALLLASLAGYQVARAALAPVDRMRAQAATIGSHAPSERLPEPGTGDELDRLATTLNELLDRLSGALERERRIVGDASHELRTPISVLRMRIDVARHGEQTIPRLQKALAEADGDAIRLARLADDLLVLARADQGELRLRLEPLDVQDILEDAASRHRAQLQADGRAVRCTVAIEGGAVVLADPGRVAQCLDNLIVNAQRYGAGDVHLTARADDGGGVALSVRDYGPGYPPSFLPRAFVRFSQADVAHGGEGTGLGLAIVAAIASAHGGHARAENAVGGGAITTLVLPAA